MSAIRTGRLRVHEESAIDSSAAFNSKFANGKTMVGSATIRQIAFDCQQGEALQAGAWTNCISTGKYVAEQKEPDRATFEVEVGGRVMAEESAVRSIARRSVFAYILYRFYI